MQRLAAVFCSGWLAACSPVDPATLTPIPEIRTERFLPGVQAQLGEAFESVQRRPVDARANGHLAMLLQTYKQFNAADAVYRRARALEPDEFDWVYLHGIVLIAVGNPDGAIAAFESALALEPNYAMAKVRLAGLLAERGDRARAAVLFEEIMGAPAPPAEAYFEHGKFLFDTGRLRQAVASFEETLRRSGDLGVAHYQLGLAHRELGETSLAERHLKLARKYQGYSGDSSDRVLNQLLPLNLSEQPFVHRARVLAENSRFDEAKRFIAMALERNPDSVAAHASMMGMAARDGDFAAVDAHYERAIAIEPDNAKVYFNLGMARIAEERLVEARRAFARSIELDDTDANAQVQIAILDERSGDRHAAERHLRRAVDLDPEHTVAAWLLGELLSDTGKPDEAIPLLQYAADAGHAMTPLILAVLAQAQVRASRLDAAAATIERARASAARHPDASLRARIDAVARELEEAKAHAADRSG